ncbi:hypothetical protein ACI2KS_10745 [Pseudomonas sp. NPDC087358]|uniref:hypothetical protein n=1 Tax=Pseudomonas sp. NPDC087358 TaxID=3364439 RepID=UPI00384C3EC3
MRLVPLKASVLACVTLATTGCASIISESKYPVAIHSSPPGASYNIMNQSGAQIHSGQTPDQITLESGAGYFEGEAYTVTYRKDGYLPSTQTLNSGIDGWYWGNIVLGGLIGMLIVDPATGAMFSLPERISTELTPAPVES